MSTGAGEPSISQRTVFGTIWMILWRILSRFLGLLSTLVLARLLVPADFGIVAMATAFAAGVEGFSQLGLNEALIRRHEEETDLLNTAFTLQLMRCIASALVLAAGAPFAASWFAEPRLTPVLWVLALSLAISGFENIGVVEFRRRMQASEQIVLLLMPRLVQVGVGIAAALILRSYWALPLAALAGRIARVATTYARHPFRPSLSLHRWRELAMFSVWSWAASLVRLIWDRADSFVLGPVVGSRALGVYLLGSELALLPVTELVEPVAGVIFPAIAAVRRRGQNAAEFVPEVVGVILIGVAPLTLAVSASANCIIALLLGAQWSEAVPVVTILAINCAVAPFSYIAATALVASGDVRRDFQVMAIAAVSRCAIIYAASTTHDMRIVATGTVLAVSLEAALFLQQLYRTGRPDFGAIMGTLLRIGLAALSVVVVLLGLRLGWNHDLPSAWSAVLQGGVIAVLTAAVFVAVLAASWWAVGMPSGVETRTLTLLAETLRSRRSAGFIRWASRLEGWVARARSAR